MGNVMEPNEYPKVDVYLGRWAARIVIDGKELLIDGEQDVYVSVNEHGKKTLNLSILAGDVTFY